MRVGEKRARNRLALAADYCANEEKAHCDLKNWRTEAAVINVTAQHRLVRGHAASFSFRAVSET